MSGVNTVIWEPFLLALLFGLLVSATLHFVLVWPRHEPPEDAAGEPDDPRGAAAGE